MEIRAASIRIKSRANRAEMVYFGVNGMADRCVNAGMIAVILPLNCR